VHRAWTPGVLGALALGATAYAYVVDRGRISDAERAERAHDVFPSFRVTAVRRVEITQGGAGFVLERTPERPGRWTVELPHSPAYRADPGAVDVLLRELELAKRVREVPESEAHGVDTPRVHGNVRVGRLDYVFDLGDDAPRPDGAAYMRIDGEGAFVVGRVLKVQLLRGSDAYRERALIPYGASEVARVEVTAPATHFVLERTGSTFRVQSGQSANGLRAARGAVDRLFAALADARAESFLDDVAADRALSARPVAVRLAGRDARDPVADIELGGGCPGKSGVVVAIAKWGTERTSGCVPASIVDGVAVAPDALPDRGTFYAHADEIEAIRIEPSPDVRLDIARRGSGWHERAPHDRDLDADESDAASLLAEDVAGAKASQVRALGPGERVVPQARIAVTRTGGGVEETIEIEAPGPDGFAVARRADDRAVLRLSRDVLRRLEARPFVLRGRAIWADPFEAASVVALDTTCGAARQRVEQREGRWIVKTPAGRSADRTAIEGLADGLAHARAERWIAERDDGGFGFNTPGACSVAADLGPEAPPRGARSVGVVFGRETDGGYYAKTFDSPGVFVAPAVLRSLASGLRLQPAGYGTSREGP